MKVALESLPIRRAYEDLDAMQNTGGCWHYAEYLSADKAFNGQVENMHNDFECLQSRPPVRAVGASKK